MCNKEHPTHIKKVFITPDLTPQQQAKNKRLRAKLSELNKLEKIKNGKIVLKDVHHYGTDYNVVSHASH